MPLPISGPTIAHRLAKLNIIDDTHRPADAAPPFIHIEGADSFGEKAREQMRSLIIRIQIGFLFALMPLLSGCSRPPEYSYNYQMTIKVETPVGLRLGSSVARVVEREQRALNSRSIIGTDVEAEATGVELPNGSMLFALLRSPHHDFGSVGSFAERAYKYRLPIVNGTTVSWEDKVAALQAQSEAVRLPVSEYPRLVYLTDAKNPDTIREVNADLEPEFGPGYRVSEITVQIVKTEPTNKMSVYVPWARQSGKALADFLYVKPTSLTREVETDDFSWNVGDK